MNKRQIYLNELKKKVYFAARDGRRTALNVLLANGVSGWILQEILNQRTSENGHYVTPLIIAVINGHEDIVRLLLSLSETNIELGGDICIEKELVKNASPLWCAVNFNRLSFVKLLLQHGADIHAPTEINSTPLRPACYDGCLEIVKYLVDYGADINSCNKWGNTCLMIAAYNGHVTTVQYLCEKGAVVDRIDNNGVTALHWASGRGNLEIVKLLVCFERAGIHMKDNLSFTPIMRAAEFAKCDVVDFFVSEKLYTMEEDIQALELLGSRLAIPNINDLQSFLKYYRRSLTMRSKYMISKLDVVQITAYGNHSECNTLKDLENIQENEFLLHMEALSIRERILAPTHKEFIVQLKYMAALYADTGNMRVSLNLIKHAVLSNQKLNKHVDELLEFLCEFTTDMFKNDTVPAFNDTYQLLPLLVLELRRNIERKDEIEKVERNIETYIYCVGMCLLCANDDRELMLLRSEIVKFVRLNPKLKDGSTPLHIAVSPKDSDNCLSKTGVILFPNISVCEELIKCGANINSTDNNRNTPLHKASQLDHSCFDAHTQNKILKTLIRSGAHVDASNTDGLTAFHCAKTTIAKVVLNPSTLSLKCLTSRVIVRNGITYKYTVPRVLESFIELHR
ncbi:hypothetical protein CHS0354_019119 [Potamilus streckersoni]|uniref:Protein fem-1 homolog B n=1 Tax=Potamilus streckersoni TaxID=2493646 RepID=A0AAE0W5F2_9BIVA|nr:hypothetical protein CHS0354_019119 [Potamilus streckersoni]